MTDTDEMANAYKLSCERVARLEREINEMKESMQRLYENVASSAAGDEYSWEDDAWCYAVEWRKQGWNENPLKVTATVDRDASISAHVHAVFTLLSGMSFAEQTIIEGMRDYIYENYEGED